MQYFLEQCLQSVMAATQHLETEVFVVDNSSVDGSVGMVKEKFPAVKVIENKDNVGFSKANNQAMRMAVGEYVLLLNPDTLVEADTFDKTVDFMDRHPDAGGLGIKMVDGKGNFLPESKRSLPTPEVAFYKVFGLSRLFPRSERFGRYHLTFLDPDQTHEIEVLSGAFMLMKKKVLDQVGLLDEDFFMYGEDIDLSYRILKAGFKNYYFPDARIIHYKGESTKKGSLNYVFVFYNAMAIFARKHFSAQQARLLTVLINVAILLRASFSLVHRFINRMAIPVLDAVLMYGGLFVISSYWELSVKAVEGLHYPKEFYLLALPAYVLIWIGSVYFSGGYERPVRISRIVKGLLAGTGLILIGYGMMSEAVRFGRAVILLGSLWALLAVPLVRVLLHLFKVGGFDLASDKTKRFLVVGSTDEIERVEHLLKETFSTPDHIGHLRFTDLNELSQLDERIRIHRINEVIFCAKDIPAQTIIDLMTQTDYPEVDFKIAPNESMFLIGSNSINTAGDLYAFGMNAITKPSNKRIKRLFDTVLSLSFLVLLPVIIWFMRQPFGLVRNIVMVLIGRSTWVGYADDKEDNKNFSLPSLPRAVLNPTDSILAGNPGRNGIRKLNMMYAKDYQVSNDLNIMIKGFRNLGR